MKYKIKGEQFRAKGSAGKAAGNHVEKGSPFDVFRKRLAEHDSGSSSANRGMTPNDMDHAQAVSMWSYQSIRYERLVFETVKQGLERITSALETETRRRTLA